MVVAENFIAHPNLNKSMIRIIFNPEKDLLTSEINGKMPMKLKISEGPSPLELLLISLGACAAITAYKSLVIRGGRVKRIEVTLLTREAIDKENAPKEVEVEFSVTASNVTAKEAEEIISSSLERECTVAKILALKIKFHPRIRFKKLRE